MADNVAITAGSGTTIRTKDHSAVETQIVALDLNPAGAESLMAGAMPVTDNSGSLTVDAPVGTPVFVRLSDGSAAIATLPVSLASLPALVAGSALIGKVNLSPQTANGLTIYRNLDVGSTGANIKASAGQVYGWYYANQATSFRYLKLYNKATAPTVGTDTPVLTIPLPPLSAANVEFTNGIAFATGIGIGATTAIADNSTANPTANDVVANVLYA